jgi:Ca-activated chloride channel family protein
VSFGSPLLLLLLLIVPAAVAFARSLDRRRARYGVAFPNLDVLASVASAQRMRRRFIPPALFLLALAAASTAVARPQALRDAPAQQATIVLLVDVSGSMRTGDVRPTRLGAAQAAMDLFVKQVPPSYRVGLVAFSLWPEVLVKPTRDRTLLRENLDLLQAESGTAIGDGLAAAVAVAKSSLGKAARGRDGKLPAAIVLLSDGAQTRGTLTPQEGAARAAQGGIRVYTVALGTNHGVANSSGVGGPGSLGSVVGFGGQSPAMPPDPATLAAISQDTQGQTYLVRSAGRLNAVYLQLGSHLLRLRTVREISSWFAAAAAVLLLASLVAARLTGPRLP